jgi:5-methylcytosine-specific restriction endonuclease McrA
MLVLRRDMFTCRHCQARAEEVHHIIELTPQNINDPNVALNPDNLISLCHLCHTKITKGNDGDIVDGFIFDDDGNVVKDGYH